MSRATVKLGPRVSRAARAWLPATLPLWRGPLQPRAVQFKSSTIERNAESRAAEGPAPHVVASLDPLASATRAQSCRDEGIAGNPRSATSDSAHSHLCVERGWHSWQWSTLSSRTDSSSRSTSVCGVLKCALDSIVVGFFGFRNLREFPVVSTLGLLCHSRATVTACMSAHAALPLDINVARSKKVLCDLLCDRTSVCCSRSCSLCTAFMTSSPEAGSWSAGFGVEESCRPWQVPLHTFHQLEELPRVMGAIGKQWSATCGQLSVLSGSE